MTGTRPGLFLCLCWKYVSPSIMTAILLSFFTKMIIGDLSYEAREHSHLHCHVINLQAWDASTGSAVQKSWPWWVYIIIVLLIGMSILWIPFVALLR